MPPNLSTGPRQGQPCHPMPAYFDKYFWTHGQGSNKGGDYNSKAPGHKDRATIESRMDSSDYECTEWRCGMVTKVAKKKEIFYWNLQTALWSHPTLCHTNIWYWKKTTKKSSSKLTQEQPEIISETKTPLFWRIQDQQPMVSESASPTTQLFNPTIPGHPPLPMLPSITTQAHTYTNPKSASILSIGQPCDSNCSAFFTKKEKIIFNWDKTPVLNGTSNISDSLWDVAIWTLQPEPLPSETTNQHENAALRLDNKES